MELVIGKKNPTFNHIDENVFLGDIESVNKDIIESNNIKIIINISNLKYIKFSNITYYDFEIEDKKMKIFLNFSIKQF